MSTQGLICRLGISTTRRWYGAYKSENLPRCPESEHPMAQRTEVILIDDLDGGKGDETVRFGLDGTSYVIDLSKKNAKAIRDALTKYVDAARKEGRMPVSSHGRAGVRGRGAGTARAG